MATAFMNLDLPVVGPNGTLGPEWAELLNSALELIDEHDHSSGKGKTITPAGININQAFSLNSNNLTSINSLVFDNLSASLVGSGFVYVAADELYFNDGAGNVVQLTSGGTINVASLGTITGDYSTSTADLTYVDASKTFIFKQSATVTASIDCGPLKIFRNTSGSPYGRIQLQNSQSGNLDWFLPAAYPAGKLPAKIDAAGVITLEQIITAEIADNQITAAKLTTDSVETAKIQNLAVTTAKIADGAITQAKRAALGQQTSGSSGLFGTNSLFYVDVTNLTVTITTTGRPVFIGVIGDGSGNIPKWTIANNVSGSSSLFASAAFVRGTTFVAEFCNDMTVTSGSPPSLKANPTNLFHIDTPAAGTYTYKVQLRSNGLGDSSSFLYSRLIAYEL